MTVDSDTGNDLEDEHMRRACFVVVCFSFIFWQHPKEWSFEDSHLQKTHEESLFCCGLFQFYFPAASKGMESRRQSSAKDLRLDGMTRNQVRKGFCVEDEEKAGEQDIGSPFSSKVVVCGHSLVTLSLANNDTLKWFSSLPILKQESFWW